MQFKLETLDRRHKGHEFWKYRIKFTSRGNESIRDFHKMRAWLWECYGPGCENEGYREWIHAAKGYELVDLAWAWSNISGGFKYIYARDDAIMSAILMQWRTA